MSRRMCRSSVTGVAGTWGGTTFVSARRTDAMPGHQLTNQNQPKRLDDPNFQSQAPRPTQLAHLTPNPSGSGSGGVRIGAASLLLLFIQLLTNSKTSSVVTLK